MTGNCARLNPAPENEPFVPSDGDEVLEKSSSLPALDGSFIVNVRALGCRRGDGIKLAHVNDDGEWETGKLYKIQAKHIPAPAGGVVKTRLLYKFSSPSVRDQFYRLRKNEYGPTKEWVVLKTAVSSGVTPVEGAARAMKTKEKKKAKKAKMSG